MRLTTVNIFSLAVLGSPKQGPSLSFKAIHKYFIPPKNLSTGHNVLHFWKLFQLVKCYLFHCLEA